MKRRHLVSPSTWIILIALLVPAVPAFALLDQFVGDSAIYSAATQYMRPNVLLIVDNSNTAANTAAGAAYDPAVVYRDEPGNPQLYNTWDIWKAGQQGEFTHLELANASNALSNLTCTANSSIIQSTLLAAGTYTGRGTVNYPSIKNGGCDDNKAYTYALGNYLNYLNQPPPADQSNSQTQIVFDAVQTVVAGSRFAVNFGSMVYDDTGNKGGKILTPVSDLTDDTAFQTFLNKLPGSGHADAAGLLTSQTSRPQAEALLDAGYYFRGLQLPVSGSGPYASPIANTCDKNIVILITNGLSNKDDDGDLASIVGDYDHDGAESSPYGLGTHYLDDVAKYLYQTDNSSTLAGTQRIQTYTILAFQNSDPLVERAANPSHGRGGYRNVFSANELADALTKFLVNIVLESDTSFVAPVVPTSPENRTYSGERVYLGFFKPISQRPWHGNLKKYGINHQNQIVDKNGVVATLSDGSFNASAVSFWSSSTDAGAVEEGGAGGILLNRNFSIEPRLIYTNRGISTDLTNSSNAFNTTNITAANLGLTTDTERDNLINYIYGYDAYDDDEDGTYGTPVNGEKRYWILGDILHSKPQIVNYNTYDFTAANEADPNINKTVVFVGTNDGMLHAFRDADGKELWGFIPDRVLPNLKELGARPALHTYFVDASPMVYTFDKDNDGNIGAAEAADGDGDNGSDDKVILLFGLRRGGDAYYALDVTNPESPVLLWKITPATTGFERLGETWSDPQLGRMKIGTDQKIVAFVGGGYDRYEDSRYGNRWQFPATYTVPNQGSGNVLSSASYEPSEIPTGTERNTGRAVYAIEIADVTSGVPVVATSPTQVKAFHPNFSASYGYPPASDYDYDYPFASDIAVLDTDFNGFVDRLYVGNTGGQMWRFEVGSTDKDTWTQKAIFWDWYGAKFFYRPSLTFENGYTFLFFGTGDREHPLNTNRTDRFYAFKDRNVFKWFSDSSILNVTGNELQAANPPAAPETCTAADNSIKCILERLNDTDNYGWFIDLNLQAGEKVLASPLAFNKVAYFTTYAPNAVASTNPCEPGNLGISRLYAVNYKTGEAVLNFNNAVTIPASHNDNESTANNARARSKSGKVLRRADRSIALGVGIPSGLVVIMPPGGDAELLIGCGGGLCSEDPVAGGTIIPVYWMQW